MPDADETVSQQDFDALQREYDELRMVHTDMVENYDKAARAFNAEITELTTKILNATQTLMTGVGSWDHYELGTLIEQAIKELAP